MRIGDFFQPFCGLKYRYGTSDLFRHSGHGPKAREPESRKIISFLDSRLRGNDEIGINQSLLKSEYLAAIHVAKKLQSNYLSYICKIALHIRKKLCYKLHLVQVNCA